MKKHVFAVLTAVLIAIPLSITAAADTFTAADALLILRASVGLETLTSEQQAKFNLKGNATAADALAVLRVSVGLPAIAEPPPPALSKTEEFAAEVFRLTNLERANRGLSAFLNSDSLLNSAAMVRAEELAAVFSHNRPDGRSPFTAYTDLGGAYRALGENIASGQRTPSEVVKDWMNSDGHRGNILSSSFTHIGAGVFEKNGSFYWVQLFKG
jgi:uncharacterized protein YkwD